MKSATVQLVCMIKKTFFFSLLNLPPPHSDCAPKQPAPQALDDAAAKKLWDISASMVGLA